jgi:hypothetical protein
MEPKDTSELSKTTLEQIADVERLVVEVRENIKSAKLYAGRAPSTHHYWVDGPPSSIASEA